MWNTIQHGETFKSVLVNRKMNGELFYSDQTITPVVDVNGEITHFISSGKDITAERRAKDQLAYLHHYDILTGLPNWRLFRERLEQVLMRTGFMRRRCAIILLELHGLRLINSTYGVHAGDGVLRITAERLKSVLRPGDTAARISGCEFGLILTDIAALLDIPLLTEEIFRLIHKQIRLEEGEFSLDFNAGISVSPEDGSDYETLIKKGNIALAAAKNSGNYTCRFFSNEMEESARDTVRTKSHLGRALQAGEFAVYYQPYTASAKRN